MIYIKIVVVIIFVMEKKDLKHFKNLENMLIIRINIVMVKINKLTIQKKIMVISPLKISK